MARRSARAAPLAAKWRKLAEGRCAEKGERLTPARLAVYAELLARNRPLSAYELIALLEQRQERKIAPLTVYRHLDFLMRTGLVHRLQSAQTYLRCDHPDHAHESQFLLCSSCGHVDEVESRGLETLLSQIADEHGFRPGNAVVEVKGCAASVPSASKTERASHRRRPQGHGAHSCRAPSPEREFERTKLIARRGTDHRESPEIVYPSAADL